MEYNKKIADMRSGDIVEGFYILKGASPKPPAAGKPFLSASLADASGVIDAKVWDYTGPIGVADEGRIIKLRGTVSEYRGTPQIVIDRLRLRTESDPVELSALVPVAPIDADAYLQKVDDLLGSMEDADYQRLCRELLRRHLADFQQIPAAKSVHHGFLRGLLMHTVDMLTMADFLAGQYRAVIDRDLLLTGTLLHDFAKSKEFAFSELGLVTNYSTGGQLLGHLHDLGHAVRIGQQRVQFFLQLRHCRPSSLFLQAFADPLHQGRPLGRAHDALKHPADGGGVPRRRLADGLLQGAAPVAAGQQSQQHLAVPGPHHRLQGRRVPLQPLHHFLLIHRKTSIRCCIAQYMCPFRKTCLSRP